MRTKEQLVSLGLTEMKADEVMLLESKMMETAVKFQFKKKDGTIRDALGTLVQKLMVLPTGEPWTPKGDPKPEVPENFRYWDLEKQMWREMKLANFVGMEG